MGYARTRRALGALVAAAALVATFAAPGVAYQRPGHTVLATVSSDGSQGRYAVEAGSDATCGFRGATNGNTMDLTPDGRYLAFASFDDNLAPHDLNTSCDVFVRDLGAGTTRRISIGLDGLETVGSSVNPYYLDAFPDSMNPSISANGRYVAFSSAATNIVPGDTDHSWDVFVSDTRTGRIRRVSVSSTGAQEAIDHPGSGAGAQRVPASFEPSISADGRYVAFVSTADNLVRGDTNDVPDVFVHDVRTGKTTRVSVTATGHQSENVIGSWYPSIDADGRVVAFTSYDPLTPGDQLGYDVFVRNLRTKKTVLVSAGTDGTAANNTSYTDAFGGRQISADGRFVTFFSYASNLVPNDANASRGVPPTSRPDIFVRDLETGRTQRVSVTSDGEVADYGGSDYANFNGPLESSDLAAAGSISPDGRYVVFTSIATNLNNEKTGPDSDVFVYDRVTGAQVWESVTPSGGESTTSNCVSPLPLLPLPKLPLIGDLLPIPGGGSFGGAISRDGRVLAFGSCSADLVKKDTNGVLDVFARERGSSLDAGLAGTSRRSARSSLGGAALSSVPDSALDVGALAAGRGADLIGATVAVRPQTADLFVREELKDLPQVQGPGALSAILYGLDLTVRGVRFQVRVQHAGVDRFGLFRLGAPGVWTQVATLRGGYGTTGQEVVFSVPLRAIGLQAGGRLAHVRAFTALGSFDAGPVTVLDRVALTGRSS